MAKKQQLSTREAFEAIINDRQYRLQLTVEEQRSLGSYKSLYQRGKLSLENIGAFLEKHGYQKTQEPLWEKL